MDLPLAFHMSVHYREGRVTTKWIPTNFPGITKIFLKQVQSKPRETKLATSEKRQKQQEEAERNEDTIKSFKDLARDLPDK